MEKERIGVYFNILNEYSHVLSTLLDDLFDIPSYWVRGYHEEIYTLGSNNDTIAESLLPDGVLTLKNTEVKSALKNTVCYPIFLKFSIYETEPLEYI
ncbi:DUF2691 family protein, partial [Pseudomonas sp. 2995-3]|uniref:DUF2691 family protein n=1 Tax=Pseudomonas sp. 2995-3 TaxID=1712680 RepID=UPI00117BC750